MDRNSRGSRSGWAVGLAALALLQGWPAAAADQELLDILLANGAINEEQYEQLLEKEELTREDVRKVIVTLDGKGFRVRSSDGAFGIRVGARLHADANGHYGNGSSRADNGTEIRRGRLNVQGTVWEDFLFQAEADFADNEVAIKDFLVGYTGLSWGKFIVGHQKQPFSLAVEMSSNDIPFVERGTDTDLVIPFIDRAIGFRADFSGQHWYVTGGIYGDTADKDVNGNEGWGSTLRGVWAPLLREDRVLHLGARGAFREPDDDRVRIRSETTHLSNLFTVDTGILTDIDEVFLVGPEAAFAIGPFSLVGEYYHVFINRRGANLGFDGFHVEATWSVTGESRAETYKIGSGEFKMLRPARNFSLRKGGFGAFEVATRYAWIDLNDRDVSGGRQGVFTLALNWYLNPAIRVLFNWSRIVNARNLLVDADGLNTLQGRVQFNF
ncbi:MAG: porin [Myxococcota bacterium]|nr:porin [Myxococcota bacterium]